VTFPAIIAALLLLFFGQRLYWLFVGCVGFIFGMQFGATLLAGQPQWMVLVAALVIGIGGALLALLFQRLAVGIAAFAAGGMIAQELVVRLLVSPANEVLMVAYFIGGILAALCAMMFLDLGLVVISALVGAAALSAAMKLEPVMHAALFAGLFILGAAFQWNLLRSRRAISTE